MAAAAEPALPLADNGKMSATLTPPPPIGALFAGGASGGGELENRSPVDSPPLPVHPDRIAPAATMSATPNRRARLKVPAWNACSIPVPRRRTYTPKDAMSEINAKVSIRQALARVLGSVPAIGAIAGI